MKDIKIPLVQELDLVVNNTNCQLLDNLSGDIYNSFNLKLKPYQVIWLTFIY